MLLAEILLDEGKIAQAGETAERSVEILERKRAGRSLRWRSMVLLKRCWRRTVVAEARVVTSRSAMPLTGAVTRSCSFAPRPVAAEVDGVSGSPADTNSSIGRLSRVITKANDIVVRGRGFRSASGSR